MKNFELTTPVAFIIFNRPDTTEQVFQRIREAKPKKLLVIADGPRENRIGEDEKCAKTRAIIDQVDWDCEVLKNYSSINLGCGKRPATGITWVFEQVEEAIILEDDCLPHPTFFRFCQEMLQRYATDERIMHISGNNFQFKENKTKYSYYFSKFNHIWGWASWRRAWQLYDYDMTAWPDVNQMNLIDNIFKKKEHANFWRNTFEAAYDNVYKDYWDYQWTFACWAQGGLSILPNGNLVTNIGFGPEATHTKEPSKFNNMELEEMIFPLTHPKFPIINYNADTNTQQCNFSPPPFLGRVKNKIKRTFRSPL